MKKKKNYWVWIFLVLVIMVVIIGVVSYFDAINITPPPPSVIDAGIICSELEPNSAKEEYCHQFCIERGSGPHGGYDCNGDNGTLRCHCPIYLD
ncbi:MAG: hypothetical protein ABIH25_03860 [Candidatus Woesearchaeota archaeon]